LAEILANAHRAALDQKKTVANIAFAENDALGRRIVFDNPLRQQGQICVIQTCKDSDVLKSAA